MPFDNLIRTPGELAELYDEPSDGVRAKAVASFDEHCRAFIARSPFVLVATADADGRGDVSPRGGAPGFVSVLARTFLLCLAVPALVWDRDQRGLHDRAANTVVVRL